MNGRIIVLITASSTINMSIVINILIKLIIIKARVLIDVNKEAINAI